MDICKTKPPKGEEISWAKNCLSLYTRLEQVLGPLFITGFFTQQIGWIVSLFLTITLPIGSTNINMMSVYCTCFGYALLSLGFLLFFITLSFLADDLHKSLSNVIDTLEDMPMAKETKKLPNLSREYWTFDMLWTF